jgi:hypothetical protein
MAHTNGSSQRVGCRLGGPAPDGSDKRRSSAIRHGHHQGVRRVHVSAIVHDKVFFQSDAAHISSISVVRDLTWLCSGIGADRCRDRRGYTGFHEISTIRGRGAGGLGGDGRARFAAGAGLARRAARREGQMTPERWRRIGELYEAAVRIDPTGREAWLRAA